MNFGHLLCEIASLGETDRVTAAAATVERPDYSGYSKTEKVLAMMLTENTGAHILDSGGAYGRAWQRNLTRDFKAEPATTVTFRASEDRDGTRDLEINVEHNVFHWLVERCDYSRAMTKRFLRFAEGRDDSWCRTAEAFGEHLTEQGHEVGGIYGEGEPFTTNTYNGECLLSQTLQFTYMTVDGDPFIILQVHGGADVRGGYTDPKVFSVNETDIFDYARAGIAPDYSEVKALNAAIVAWHVANPSLPGMSAGPSLVDDDIAWHTDDAYHYYFQGACGGSYTSKQLDKLPCKEIADRSEWEKGTVCVFDDGSALCPFTGCKLEAGWY